MSAVQAGERDVSATSSAAQGSAALIAAFFATGVLNYVFAVVMTWLLPVDRYGMLAVIQTILLVAATVGGAGFPWVLVREIAKGSSGQTKADDLRAALIGNLGLGLILAALLYGGMVTGWLHFGAGYMPLVLVALATIVSLAIYIVFAAALQGLFRFNALAFVRGSEALGKFASGIALVVFGLGALGAVLGTLIGTVVGMLLSVKLVGDVKFWRGRGWGSRQMYVTSLPFFIGMLSLWTLGYVDTLGLKLFSPSAISDELTGYYQAAATLTRIPLFMAGALFEVIFSYVARYSNDPSMGSVYARLTMKYTLLFIVPVDLMLMVIPDGVIRLLYSSKYDSSARPLVFAAFGCLLLVLVQALATLLQGSGKLKVASSITFAAAVVEVVALRWFVPRLGTVGAGLGLVVAAAFGLVLLAPATFRRYQLAPRLGVVVRFAGALFIFVASLWLLPHQSRVSTVAGILVAGVLYVLALVRFGLLRTPDIELLVGGFPPLARRIRPVTQVIELLNPAEVY
ncbi:MAG: oligosaccharide flippase family protein [Chloroflexota bacterium]